jgi:hypothetical protein
MRHPTSAEWARINMLFDRLLDVPTAEREARLLSFEAGDYINRQVRAMLTAHGTIGLLDEPLVSPEPIDTGYSSLPPGAAVGAFRIGRLIGRGGMGEVYLAERTDGGFTQRVALKLLRPEAVGQMALFDGERHLLAQLEHPGIARLIDGGLAPDGRPFMALEYVEGEPIAQYCAAHHATLDRRVVLMLEICDAVSFAHSRLIVHRDIKPANVLVDTSGRARLLDFGVAKLIDGVVRSDATTQPMLTPGYAAPEQLRRGATTVAADVYALGGLLYELLTGQGAWHRGGSALPATLMRIGDAEPELPSKAAARAETPPVPPFRIKGDLDAIIAKAMRHDPDDRYPSVASLASDLRRYRRYEPVEARRAGLGYQFRRFVRRHQAASLASAIGLLVLLAGASGIAWQAHKAAVERDIARSSARRAEAVNQAMSLMFRNAQDFGKGGSASAHDLLDDSAARLVGSFGDRSPDTAPVVSALAELYLQIDDVTGAQSLLSSALEKGVGRDDPAAHARLLMDLGTVEGATGKLDEAKANLAKADTYWATDPERFRKERLEAAAAHAQILRQEGKRDEAIEILTASLPEAEIAYSDNPRTLLIRYNNLAVHLAEANRLDELDAILKRAEAVVRQNHQERSPIALALIQLRGGWYARNDRPEEALAAFMRAAAIRRELYGPSRFLATDLLQVGRTLVTLGRVEAALPILIEAQAMARRYTGPASPGTIMAGISIGEAYGRLGKAPDARAALAAIQPALAPLGPKSILLGAYLRARVWADLADRDYGGANADLTSAERIFAALGPAAEPYIKSIPALRTAIAARARAHSVTAR